MTTCLWDGISLHADTRAITGDVIDQFPCQKIYQRKGIYCAIAGDVGEAIKLAKYLLKNSSKEKPPKFKKDSFELLLVSKDRCEYYPGNLKPLPTAAPFAIGSGGIHAVTAMRCGKKGRSAIRIAAKLDANTGCEFGIRTHKIR